MTNIGPVLELYQHQSFQGVMPASAVVPDGSWPRARRVGEVEFQLDRAGGSHHLFTVRQAPFGDRVRPSFPACFGNDPLSCDRAGSQACRDGGLVVPLDGGLDAV